MGINDLPILSMLRERMQWSQARQRILAENVANSNTPGFRPQDLAPPKFDTPDNSSAARLTNVALARTEPGHLGGFGDAGGFRADREANYDVRLSGNAVNLEDEMMKVAANQIDYQTATALYTRSLNLLKTALGKR